MADKYQALVSGRVGKKLATQFGLPRPAVLRRYDASAPLLPGPVLVSTIGTSAIGAALERRRARRRARTRTPRTSRKPVTPPW